MARKPKLAVWKFASCVGCQLSVLSCEDELLTLAGQIEIAYFLEASSAVVKGPYDLSLVEGSITTPHDAERIQKVRRASRSLVTIRACATAGGIQALRNFRDVKEFISIVYARPEYISTLEKSTAIAAHVKVDFELRGCPINKNQLVDVINAFIHGRAPSVPPHSVCLDCKRKGVVCVMVARGVPCMGPVTHTGCGVLCPSYARGCYGCFGPKENPNTESLADWFVRLGSNHDDILREFRNFNSDAPAFRLESQRQESKR
jgi:coenzyme F420-reducing hydrogenase gamma subunit